MKYFLKLFFLLTLVTFSAPSFAVKIEFHSFEDPKQERLYLNLIAELRCVKCQNQNLAESNAELARDMREKTYEMVIAGKTREDVVSYMTARYGDFVLYKPPFKSKTFLLWVGPPILLLLSLFLLIKRIRKQSLQAPEKLNQSDRDSINNLLNSPRSSQPSISHKEK